MDARISRSVAALPEWRALMRPTAQGGDRDAPACLAGKVDAISQSVFKVFVVDDDPEVLESLHGLISTKGWDLQTFCSAQEFLAAAQHRQPCCLLLDVSLLGISGLDLQAHLKTEGIQIPIIFMTGFGDIPMTVKAMKAGAVEFLTKPFRHEDLFGAIDRALQHSASMMESEKEVAELRERHASLSRREQEVFALVVSGLMNKQVGFKLGISEITVKAHRGSMMRKMKARSLAELIKMSAKIARPSISAAD
jgi:FixJ family two-component response regulator